MSKRRPYVSLKTKLAAALCQMKRSDADGKLVPMIPDDVRAKGEAAILAHVQWDHNVPVALDGGNDHSNLQPLPKNDHKAKTRRDVAAIAKVKRLTAKQAEFRRKILAKTGQAEPESKAEKPKRRWKPQDHVWDWKKRRWVEEKKEAAE